MSLRACVRAKRAGEPSVRGDTTRRKAVGLTVDDGPMVQCAIPDAEGKRDRESGRRKESERANVRTHARTYARTHACVSAGSREFYASVYRSPSHPRAGDSRESVQEP